MRMYQACLIEGSLDQGMFWAEFTEKNEANDVCLVTFCQKDDFFF
jgi:hypothetical protein